MKRTLLILMLSLILLIAPISSAYSDSSGDESSFQEDAGIVEDNAPVPPAGSAPEPEIPEDTPEPIAPAGETPPEETPQEGVDAGTPEADEEPVEDDPEPEEGTGDDDSLPELDGALISVSLPENSLIVFNPYYLKYNDDFFTDEQSQIICPPLTITNNGEEGFFVNFTGCFITVTDEIWVEESPDSEPEGEKTIFLYLSVEDSDSEEITPYSSYNFNQMVLSETPAECEGVWYLEPGGSCDVRISGSMAPDPEIPWGLEDDISFSIRFSFTPE